MLCLDVGVSMNIAPPDGGETHLEAALAVAKQIIQQKVNLCVVYFTYTHTHTIIMIPATPTDVCRQ